jgi:hypothetical protein
MEIKITRERERERERERLSLRVENSRQCTSSSKFINKPFAAMVYKMTILPTQASFIFS